MQLEDSFWESKVIDRIKKETEDQFGEHPIAHSLWADEPFGWIDHPSTEQDYLYNKILFDWEGSAYRPQVRVPNTEWLIHYTNKQIPVFNVGRRFLDNLKDQQFAGGHTSYLTSFNCQEDWRQPNQRGFQYGWSVSQMIYDKYYPSTIWRHKFILFRSNAAVQHLGDNGEVIFLTCSDHDLTSFTFEGTTNSDGTPQSGFWINDKNGQQFITPLELVQWADTEYGLKRIWPLPIPGYFKSKAEIEIWGRRMIKVSWSAYLMRSLREDLLQLLTFSETEALTFFNDKYATSLI